jgi:hypothetical protein
LIDRNKHGYIYGGAPIDISSEERKSKLTHESFFAGFATTRLAQRAEGHHLRSMNDRYAAFAADALAQMGCEAPEALLRDASAADDEKSSAIWAMLVGADRQAAQAR